MGAYPDTIHLELDNLFSPSGIYNLKEGHKLAVVAKASKGWSAKNDFGDTDCGATAFAVESNLDEDSGTMNFGITTTADASIGSRCELTFTRDGEEKTLIVKIA